MPFHSGRPELDIVIADDVEDSVDSLAVLLVLHGYVRVRTTAGGDAALNMLLAEPTDVAILDLLMVPVSGLDICRFVKAHQKSTFAIAISGFITLEAREGARLAGFNEFIMKAGEEDKLLDLLDGLSRVQPLNG